MADDKDDQVQDPASDDDGPKLCDAVPAQCDLDICDMDEEGPEARPRDELADSFPLTTIRQVRSPVDGLPVPAGERMIPDAAPPFTREHSVCVEDKRTYVELFAEELHERGWKYKLKSSELEDEQKAGWCPPGCDAGHFWVSLAVVPLPKWETNGSERKRRSWARKDVHFGYGYAFVLHEDGKSLIPLRPKRERCKFYKRQDYANTEQPDPHTFGHHVIARNCLARRSIGGAAMSVSDEAVYACDYREPPDPETTKYFLDDPDDKHLDSGAHKKKVPLFGNV